MCPKPIRRTTPTAYPPVVLPEPRDGTQVRKSCSIFQHNVKVLPQAA